MWAQKIAGVGGYRRVSKAQRAHADTMPVATRGSSQPRQNRVGAALWPLSTLRWLIDSRLAVRAFPLGGSQAHIALSPSSCAR